MKAWEAELYDSKSHIQFEVGIKVLNELNVKNGERVLDIGCGTGRLTIEIAKKTPSGTVIGLDNNQDMIDKANENLTKSGLKNLQFVNESILDYDPEFQFNAIFSNSALHWIPETHDLYFRIYNLLLSGGRICAQMPAKGGLGQIQALFIAPIESLNLSGYFKNWTYPIKSISPDTLNNILLSIGFNDIQVRKVTHKIPFNSPEELLTFLKTAALVPILSQLPIEEREHYENYLLDVFRSKGESILDVKMKRLFLNAKK